MPDRLTPALALCLGAALLAAGPGAARPQGAVASPPDCGGMRGVEALPTDPMVLVGELHGTDAGPAAFGALACRVARRHGAVAVGLEISHREQARIDRFLASDGGPEDRARLLAGDFWTASYQDGRRSRATARLLERLRALRAAGLAVEVVAFDPLPDVEPGTREEGLARRLTDARRARPEVPFLVLTGNLHARVRRGAPWDEDFRPMGARIAAEGVEVFAVELRHAGGSAWTCAGRSASDCGPRPVEGQHEQGGAVPAFERFPAPEPGTGYDGALRVGAVEASPPAVESGGGSDRGS